jgi:hypothetical protein
MSRRGWVFFDFKHRNNLWSLFKGEASTTSNYQVPSTHTQNFMRLVDANNWPTFDCGKKVKRLSMFKLTQQIEN